MGSVLGRAIGPLIEGGGATLCVCDCSVGSHLFDILTNTMIISMITKTNKLTSIMLAARRKLVQGSEGNPDDENPGEKDEKDAGADPDCGMDETEEEEGSGEERETKEEAEAETGAEVPDGTAFKSMIDVIVSECAAVVHTDPAAVENCAGSN